MEPDKCTTGSQVTSNPSRVISCSFHVSFLKNSHETTEEYNKNRNLNQGEEKGGKKGGGRTKEEAEKKKIKIRKTAKKS